MMQTTQDRNAAHLPGAALMRCGRWHGWRLTKALMWSLPVEVGGVLAEHTRKAALAEDQDVIQVLAPHAAEEPLAHGVGPRCAMGRVQNRDVAGFGNALERLPTLAVIVPDEESRPLPKRRGFPESCWATQASVGWRVAPTCTTRRVASSTTKNANSGRKRRSVPGRKSQAQIAPAWWRRKVAHVCPRGRGGRWPRR